jgi:hypothetical protein
MRSIHTLTARSFSAAAQATALLSVTSYTIASLSLEAGVVGTVLLAADEASAATVTVPGGPPTLVPNFSYLQPQSASSTDLIYNWTGTCAAADVLCVGSRATATLTLTNAYVPGQALNASEIVSFQYSRPATSGGAALNLGLATVGTTTSGALPASTGNPVGTLNLFFQTAGQGAFSYDEFTVNTNGSWALGWALVDPGHLVGGTTLTYTYASGDGNSDPGSSQFSLTPSSTPLNPTPLPGSLGLFATGLAGLWAIRRKKRAAT